MIGHDNEGAEINAIVLQRETKCGDNDRACLGIENWLLWT